MAKTSVRTSTAAPAIEFSALEAAAARARTASVRTPAVVRGWKAASNPDYLNGVRAVDEARISALTAKLLADLKV